MAQRNGSLALTAPTMPLFAVSAGLAIAAALAHYGAVAIPIVSAHAFDTLLLAFAIMTAGVLMRRA